MTYTVIIPARYGSSRLPGKPLLDIAGKPMVQHVYERACQSSASRVLVATDDDRIAKAVKDFGGEVCMTLPSHESGTDRLQEVVTQLALANDEVVVNVQGDEPLIPPAVIDQVAANLSADKQFAIATLVERITEAGPLFDPNAVKVALGNNGNALYFSRATIPWHRDHFASEKTLPAGQAYWRHIGIYAYRVSFLHNFVTWPAGQLEQVEKLEQLRALENGARIHAAPAIEGIPAGVDTEADLATVRQWFVNNGAAL